jgi:cytochrome c-type biogenesis protein CcmH
VRRTSALAFLLGSFLFTGSLRSQVASSSATAPADTALDRQVREVASLLRCPVCLNLSVQDSPSELARDMRDVVRDHLARGETEQQVIDYFIQRYGEWVLMKPPAHGVSLLVWLLPAIMVIGGGALVVTVVQRWMRNSVSRAKTAEDVPEEELRKVRAELARERDEGRLD